MRWLRFSLFALHAVWKLVSNILQRKRRIDDITEVIDETPEQNPSDEP